MMAVMIVRICSHGGHEDHMDFEAHENWEDCKDGDSDEAGLKKKNKQSALDDEVEDEDECFGF